MVTIKIELQKKKVFLITIFVIFLIGAGIVIAGSGNYALYGHSYDEIQPCSSGQILKYTSSGWACSADQTGSVLPTCSSGQVLKSTGSGWTCGTDNVGSFTCPSGRTPADDQCLCYRTYSGNGGVVNVVVGMGTCGTAYSDREWGCDGGGCSTDNYCVTTDAYHVRTEVRILRCV